MKRSADILQPAGGRSASGTGPVLLERRPVAADLLRLKLSRPPGFAYRAGQHVKMGVPGLLRTYSLVSAPHEDHLEFFVELYPGGRLSERLRAIGPGTPMALGSAGKGDLKLDAARVDQFLIATVTGIAPFVSLLRDHLRQPRARHRFFILHGASHADEFGYAAELTALMERDPAGLVYLPTVSRPDSPRNRGWQGARGRVETLAVGVVERFRLAARDTAVLACGNPAMVRTVSDLFAKLGFTTHTEPFT
jgi:ferredoxin-NADP reductase